MRRNGRDNAKKLWSFISIQSPPKYKRKNKSKLNEYSDFAESLFQSDSKSIPSNSENKNH